VDPARAFGKPIVRNCAVPTSILAASYEANGRDPERVAGWYGIAPQDVEVAVQFERRFFGKAA
jgi:uncharacterized protein (DUF433 family)